MKRKPPSWQPESFLDNFAAAIDALGFENAGLAWGLANVRFENIIDREKFLEIVTAKPADKIKGESGWPSNSGMTATENSFRPVAPPDSTQPSSASPSRKTLPPQ